MTRYLTASIARCRTALPLLGVLMLAACQNTDGTASRAFASDGETADSAAIARADSIAAWKERFGDRVQRPDSVRALYVNGWAAGSRSRMAELIRVADETEINALVIDIKESDTYLVYDSTGIELAKEIGADTRPGSNWLPALLDTLMAHDIYPIARIVAFKDRMLAEKYPQLAIQNVNGGVWLDQNGKPWVSPYNKTVWDYNVAIAKEALDMGFSEIQWDYVRFPDVRSELRATMAFPGANGVSYAENIANFIDYSKAELAEYQVPVTADVFGLSTHADGDVGIGQQWEKVITSADVVLPMVYPSHYYAGMYGFSQPNAHPYEIVRISLEEGVRRTEYLREQGEEVGEIMAWLEAQTASWVKPTVEYGPRELRDQIQAAYDSGVEDWVLWNPGSKFERYYPAFRPEGGGLSQVEKNGWKAPEWEVPYEHPSIVIRRRDAAEKAAKLAADSARAAQAAVGTGEKK